MTRVDSFTSAMLVFVMMRPFLFQSNRYAVRRGTPAFGRERGAAGSHTIALSDRMLHVASGHTSRVPHPPYVGSSLDHATHHSAPLGGASSGSAKDARFSSGPRFT